MKMKEKKHLNDEMSKGVFGYKGKRKGKREEGTEQQYGKRR